MSKQKPESNSMTERDRTVVWHPYSSMINVPPQFPVVSASGVHIKLADGRELIDGMASWWCAIHGYNHPKLNAAISSQISLMAHVMFGGLTHEPAIQLAEELVKLSPDGLETVFFSDSGSVAVEIAMKMAIQYWVERGIPEKTHFLTVKGGYHGDTFGAMSVCDPVTGLHTLFSGILASQFFADRPSIRFDEEWGEEAIHSFASFVERQHGNIAAVILEPVVQGAGGMWFYNPVYLQRVRQLCSDNKILLIFDEIATGFGRTGKMFASHFAQVSPDIMCTGKALTGGYLSLGATLVSRAIANTISASGKGVFMHGPTFMANPLACAVSLANLKLLQTWPWQDKVLAIERQLGKELAKCREIKNVKDVRVLGAIGVVELAYPVDIKTISIEFVNRGVWVRPFGNLVYIMPPYIIKSDEISRLTGAICDVVSNLN